MKYKIEFQYKDPESSRPYDELIHEEEYMAENGEYIPCPMPGDSVYFGTGRKAYKVLTRHFGYVMGWCCINIVVTDIDPDEMAARLKE